MEFRYKQKDYKAQLKRPHKKRCYKGGALLRESSYFDSLYNNPFRIKERLSREEQRERENKKHQNQLLKIRCQEFKQQNKYLDYSLNKIFKVMKNSTIIGFFKPTISNVIDNVISGLNITNDKVINRLKSLNWFAIDFSTQETQKATFKNELAKDMVLCRYLNIAEYRKSNQAKKAQKAQAQELQKALSASGLSIEQLIAIAQAQATAK